MMAEKEQNLSYIPLRCSQATALEESERIVAKQQTPESPVLPVNDETNACYFLSFGIINSLEMISHKLVSDHAMTGEKYSHTNTSKTSFSCLKRIPLKLQ